MTRTEAIAIITAKLASFDDEQVSTLADIAQDMDAEANWPVRQLSPRELSLLEQSKADFAAGRSTSLEEGFAQIDARLAERAAQTSTS